VTIDHSWLILVAFDDIIVSTIKHGILCGVKMLGNISFIESKCISLYLLWCHSLVDVNCQCLQ